VGRHPRRCPPRQGPRSPRPISAAPELEPEPSPGPVRRALAPRAPAPAALTKAARAAMVPRPVSPARPVRQASPARPARGRAPAGRGRQVRVRPVPAHRGRVRHVRAARGQAPGLATTRSARRRPAWAPRPRPAPRDPACPDPAQGQAQAEAEASVIVPVSRQAGQEVPTGRRVPAARARRTAVRAGPTVRVRAVPVPAAPGRAQ
jgi:hypothetical protein